MEITEETVEETPEAEPKTQELPEEPAEETDAEEPAEELHEEPAEELPEEEKTPEEEGETVKVTFTDEFRVAVPADGEDITSEVTWRVTLEDATACEDVSAGKDGILTFPAGKGGEIVVTAVSADGVTASLNVELPEEKPEVSLMVSSVILSAPDVGQGEGVSAAYDRKGLLKSVTLNSADIVSTSVTRENTVSLESNVPDGNVSWKSSKPKVAGAYVTGADKFTVFSGVPGTAILTFWTIDGTNRTFKLKVVVK